MKKVLTQSNKKPLSGLRERQTMHRDNNYTEYQLITTALCAALFYKERVYL